jgi:hypothetical protein
VGWEVGVAAPGRQKALKPILGEVAVVPEYEACSAWGSTARRHLDGDRDRAQYEE